MDAFTAVVDYLASPPRLFALVLVVFLACRSTRLPWSRAGGGLFLLLTVAFLGVGLSDEVFRRLILHPERLPVVVLVLSSVAVLWLEMRRFYLPEGQSAGVRWLDRPPAKLPVDAVVATAVGLVLVALVLLQPAGLGAEADPASRPDSIKAPWFFVGLQELDTYFDPWVPYFALPLLLVVGLLGLPHLETGDAAAGRRRSLFLLGWLLLWLWPMAVGAVLRGPHWNAFGPFETWDPSRPAALAPRPLSEVFWIVWLRGFQPASWWLRELPGMLLLGGYFVLLPLALRRWKLTRGAFESYLKAMGAWRFRAALTWVLAVMIVPLKMYGQWLWDIGYWIHLPELSVNF